MGVPKLFKKSQVFLISPWLLAGAIILFTLIIAILAANNLKQGKEIITDSLERKGHDIIRFIGAGARAARQPGQRRNTSQIQKVIEQVAENPEIIYITVFDAQGVIVANSNPETIGQSIDQHLSHYFMSSPEGATHVIDLDKDLSALEVYASFQPFRHRQGRGMRNHQNRMMRLWEDKYLTDRKMPTRETDAEVTEHPPDCPGSDCGCPAPNDNHPIDVAADLIDTNTEKLYIAVGLDMQGVRDLMARNRFNMIILSVILLLVGLGGWISLMAAQAFKTSQETLKHIKAFTDLLIARLPVGVIATDPDGLIKTYNQSAAAMTGKNQTEAVGHQPVSILPTVLADFFSDSKHRQILDKEVTLSGPNGRDTVLHVSSVPIIDQENAYVGRVLLLHDLTELKRLEINLRHHDRFVALGKMAAGVAHEVRNPLSSIKGFATLISNKLSPGSTEHDATQLMINEVERLNRSITELLDYARPIPLAIEEIDIAELVQDSLKLIASDAKQSGVTIKTNFPIDLPTLAGDRDRLKQVLLNLYLNSLQAMEKGGELGVGVQFTKDKKTMSLWVQDSGAGIPAGILEKVRDPYFTTKPEGTGLGLAMVSKIVAEHGGSLKIKSREGNGTEIRIDFKIQDERPASESA